MADLPSDLPTLLTHRRRTRARLLRVQRAIGVCEELACAAAMPPALLPRPSLDPDQPIPYTLTPAGDAALDTPDPVPAA
jgi:hypothetical protein